MSLLVLDGFDDGARSSRFTLNGDAVSATDYGQHYGNVLELTGTNDYIHYSLPSASASVTIGYWVLFNNYPSLDWISDETRGQIRFLGDGSTVTQVMVSFTPGGTFKVARGDGTVLGETGTVWAPGVPLYVEISVTVSNTVGAVTIHVNGAEELAITSADTDNGSTGGTIDKVELLQNGRSSTGGGDFITGPRITDLYVASDATLRGPMVVESLFPSGNGNYSNFTGSDGNSTDNYLLVDEATPDDDTTYVESSTDTDRDSYAFDDLVETSGDIVGVIASVYCKNGGGADNLQAMTRISATDYDGSTQAVPAGYGVLEEVWETSPATATAWTISEVNGAEFGVENVA